MRITALAIAGGAAAAAAALTLAAPARAADQFGSTGVIISADRVMPLVSYTHTSEDNSTGGSTSSSNTSIALVTSGIDLYGGDLYNLPRLAIDVAVIPHLTLGGSAWVYTQLSSSTTDNPPNNQPSTSTDQPKWTYWGFAPRIGYVFNVGHVLAIWPRAGVEYHNLSSSSTTQTVGGISVTTPGSSFWQLAADLEAMLVITPWNHFGITLGPTADIPITGKVSTTSTTTSGGTTTTTTNSNNASVLQVGASVGLLGYF